MTEPEVTVYVDAIRNGDKVAIVLTNSASDDISVQILDGEFPEDE